MVQELCYNVGGMTCRGCAVSIKEGLASVPGILDVRTKYRERSVTIWYEENLAAPSTFKERLSHIGFPVITGRRAWVERLAPLIVAVLLFELIGALPLGMAPRGSRGILPDQAMTIGFATSIHCLFMCGGIMTARLTKLAAGSLGGYRKKPLLPHALLYNVGRAVTYVLVGLVVGGIGEAFAFSDWLRTVLLAIAGTLLVLFGLRQMELLPRTETVVARRAARPMRRAARRIQARLNRLSAAGRTFTLGMLNGFMPCGALMAMWFAAAGSGSATAGAIIMGAFALGTAPALLCVGVIADLLPERLMRIVPMVGCAVTVALGLRLVCMVL